MSKVLSTQKQSFYFYTCSVRYGDQLQKELPSSGVVQAYNAIHAHKKAKEIQRKNLDEWCDKHKKDKDEYYRMSITNFYKVE